MIKFVLVLLGIVALIIVFLRFFERPVRRTRAEIIALLESSLVSGGDDAFDDFVSIEIDDPELEAVRRKCLDVTLAPQPLFEQTLRQVLADLRKAD